MSENFPYADIIIIALIAGFILLRLRSILGQKTGHENPDFFRPNQQEQPQKPEPIIQLVEKTLKPRQPQETIPEYDPYAQKLEGEPIAKDIAELKNANPAFNATTFLDGAKIAFEMVFDAFIKGDKQTLSMLLAQDIYTHFVNDIDARASQETKKETTLLSVVSQDINSIRLDKNIARVAVRFESEQVTVERGKNGEIVSGNPSDVEHVIDEWVFERDITSKNPNWKIIET